MKRVFRVLDWDLSQAGNQDWTLKIKCNIHPLETTICGVLQRCFPGLIAQFKKRGLSFLLSFSNEGHIVLRGTLPSVANIRTIMTLLSEILTVCDAADTSHCLALYRVPDDSLPPGEWPYTEIGSLMRSAKYGKRVQAAQDIAKEMALVIAAHPAMSRADTVTAMPSSGQQGHLNTPPIFAALLARAFGFEQVRMNRTRSVPAQKATDDRQIGSTDEQANSMDCQDITGKVVLVIDDIYRTGQTMDEAARALRHRGATQVFALCAVKTARGTRGGVAGLNPE